jgi:hypothetical protein
MKRRLIESVFKLAIDEATRKDTKGRRVEEWASPQFVGDSGLLSMVAAETERFSLLPARLNS